MQLRDPREVQPSGDLLPGKRCEGLSRGWLLRADFIADLFDKPFMAGVKPLAQPLLDAMEERAGLAYLLLAAPFALLTILFVLLRPKSRKVGCALALLHRAPVWCWTQPRTALRWPTACWLLPNDRSRDEPPRVSA